MKNGLVIWNVLLSLVTGFLLFSHFNGKKVRTGTAMKENKDTSVAKAPFRIAYFEMDSIAAHFELVKELKSELTKKEEAIVGEMDNRQKALQQRYMYYQNLEEKGELTSQQKINASEELRKMDDEMKSRRQQLDQEYSNFMMTKQNDIKSKIENFLKEYNDAKDYTYIVSYEQGLFYYKDTAYNITAEVLRGLNQKYKPEKKK